MSHATTSTAPGADATTPSPQHGAPRYDLGKLIGLPASLMLVTLGTVAFVRNLTSDEGVAALEVVHQTLVLSFYALLLWAYLRRLAATSRSRSLAARVAAATATVLPVALPITTEVPSSGAWVAVGSVVTVAGLAWSVVSLRTLGRSFSVMPQARELVDHGPYAVVRHPLYLGELTASLGLVLSGATAAAATIWVVLALLQAYRATKEEAVLATAFPAYAAFRSRVPNRIVPGVW